ncbi:MAG: hypothetical protein Unbinned8472contig1000_28 [Prokaryotic dsDNA virus sp.]|nr:MAG: hypothetical protein Unbinned8472contig1000_28 [Prokaryotic dsDNA virus sp.]|tara:strand:- start:3931 stop:4089 length:159 start_codon:yes stop_codon:yes gene_type:complete
MSTIIRVPGKTKEEILEMEELIELFLEGEHLLEEGEVLTSDNSMIKRMEWEI